MAKWKQAPAEETEQEPPEPVSQVLMPIELGGATLPGLTLLGLPVVLLILFLALRRGRG